MEARGGSNLDLYRFLCHFLHHLALVASRSLCFNAGWQAHQPCPSVAFRSFAGVSVWRTLCLRKHKVFWWGYQYRQRQARSGLVRRLTRPVKKLYRQSTTKLIDFVQRREQRILGASNSYGASTPLKPKQRSDAGPPSLSPSIKLHSYGHRHQA